MKEVGLILDLYLSPIHGENVVKQAVSNFYLPIIKLIKTNRDMKVSLNIPLSTLELLDKFHYSDLILEIKDLYEKERVEIVGSSAYKSLLTDLPRDIVESQIILNEYGLGYYLGSKQGFEGEPSIMIRDLLGFVPPNLAINEEAINSLESMNYKWISISNGFLDTLGIDYKQNDRGFCTFKGKNLIGVETINLLDGDIDNSLESDDFSVRKEFIFNRLSHLVKEKYNNNLVTEQGLEKFLIFRIGDRSVEEFNLDSLKRDLESVEIFLEYFNNRKTSIVSVGEMLKNISKNRYSFPNVTDVSQKILASIHSKKYDKEDKLTLALRKTEKLLIDDFRLQGSLITNSDNYDLCMWNNEEISHIEDITLRNNICKFILLSKYISTDKYYHSNAIINNQDSTDSINIFHNDSLKSYVNYATSYDKCSSESIEKSSLLTEVGEILHKFFI